MENGKQSPAALKTEAPKFSREERKKIRSLEREVKKYETRIEEMEIELEELKQLRFDEEYYLDYQKGQELENRINGFEKELEQKYREWERLQHEAESLSG
jgi:ATP-binding cassette subfamily F protein 3